MTGPTDPGHGRGAAHADGVSLPREADVLALSAQIRDGQRLQADLTYRIAEMQGRLQVRGKQADALAYELAFERAERDRIAVAWEKLDLSAAKIEQARRAALRLLTLAAERRAEKARPRPGWRARLGAGRSGIQGHVDAVDDGIARGWVRDRGQPAGPLTVRARIGTRVIGRTVASEFRRDLADAGYGDGNCGFRLALNALGLDGLTGEVVIEVEAEPAYPLAIFDLLADEDAREMLLGSRGGTR